MSSDFYVDVRVFFPIKKKKDKPIYFPTNSQNNLSDKISSCFKKNGYNTLPGFTIIPWNQIIVKTRNAVRNDE